MKEYAAKRQDVCCVASVQSMHNVESANYLMHVHCFGLVKDFSIPELKAWVSEGEVWGPRPPGFWNL